MVTIGTTHETDTPAATEALGGALAAGLAPGSVVLLYGEMGAGKTTFVRGALRALGYEGPVTSPTYTIARHYPAAHPPATHLDLHRLADLDAEDPALLADSLPADGVAFIEWPEIAELAPELDGRVAARVRLEHVAADRRRVRIEP